MAFSDLQGKVLAQAAVDAVHAEIAPLALFAHSYNPDIEGQFGKAVAVPTTDLDIAAEFNSSTNNYTGTDEFGGELVSLDKHFVKSLRITDSNLAYTGIQFARDAGAGIGKSIGMACNKCAITTAVGTDISASWTITSKTGIVGLTKIAMDNDLPINGTVAIVSPEAWTAIMDYIGEYQVYGAGAMMQDGIARNVMGFKAILPSTFLGEGVKGVLVAENALGTVSQYLPPVFADGAQVRKVVDEENGFVLTLREFNDNATGYGYVAGTTLFGAKLVNPKGAVKLA